MNGLETIAKLASGMQAAGDSWHADKMMQLKKKLASGQLYFAFCGHFSAGKSSLINRLCGAKLLPSSPIPTSANIVSIGNGKAEVTVYRNDRAEPDRIKPEQLAEYCKNGEDIRSIDIRYPIPFLGEHAVLLDTPGIDSTDDAHRMSTESALHLADVVFYVMDYNHVQSETNFAFTKQLQDWGKPVYLIVNQIDKHREEELPFKQYKKSVEQAFGNWNIHPDGILYLSVKHPEHPHHEWSELVWLIRKLQGCSEPLRQQSAAASSEQLIRKHVAVMSASREEEKAELRAEIRQGDGLEEAREQYEQKRERLNQLKQLPLELHAEWKNEIGSIVENANLTPAATRDLAHHYLQSRKPGFKVGFFSRAAQTEKEIASRLNDFYTDFSEKVRAGLSWHLQDFIKKQAEEYGVSAELEPSSVARLEFKHPASWVADQVHMGAEFSSEYTLTYSRQLSSEVKTSFRREAMELADELIDKLTSRFEVERRQLESELAELEEALQAQRQLEQMERAEQEELKRMLGLSESALPRTGLRLPSPGDYDEQEFAAARSTDPEAADSSVTAKKASEPAPGSARQAASPSVANGLAAEAGRAAADGGSLTRVKDHRDRLRRMAQTLREAVALTKEMSALQSVSRSMIDKAERMENNRFTVALFGAFSAGKSSFANALIGERILPVSPNPTTAAINTILPPTDDCPHGTVKVVMKTEEAVLEEIRYSLDVLGMSGGTRKECLRAIAGISPEQVSEGGKPHYAFLKAVEKGWSSAEGRLGNELTADLEQFAGYVAEEDKSCFVESIRLYYSNPLTEQGMVFVDTPGADSINARHTGVAFNYIKNADAILFVTYYNHAFSQADREFLLQLGRVKDAFELDKMFFIVNAADLAADSEELSAVIEHVESNLASHGVRNARIYPVSSQQAVQGKLGNDKTLLAQSGIVEFERQFIRFTYEELSEMAVRSAQYDLQRAAATMQEWIQSAYQSEEERKDSIDRLEEACTQVKTIIREADDSAGQNDLAKEVQELLYYVRQRLTYRFGELYNLAFNPGSLREDGRDIRKLLRAAHFELVRLLSYDLSQEVLATTLRLEQFMNTYSLNRLEKLWTEIEQKFPGYPHERFEAEPFDTPVVDESISVEEPDIKGLHRFFKNGKYFFEGEGKEKLKQELEATLGSAIQQYLDRHAERLMSAYSIQFKERMSRLADMELQSALNHYQGLKDALEMKIDVDQLKRTRNQLVALTDERVAPSLRT
ncbi:dynamin family protein [Paenibacillus sp. J2TS4]|uniref:dynamin family protein n=1 Tax=Paenibacillus sp. J2TS4 TaxID=2807194 RepID=UPI001B142F95|nr:dynamin family protein [Paenibacillus sp. J2TS4]GIP32460.1 hypothetical protein J2TS4_16700 [Paenibacillus sp. J2TS4]